ncbi:Shikimate dehydrogenase [Planctomycetales bacterium 10988]|nr:Shikimate dehydrogenase [Planctomycetales bacterium 10988]
MPGAHSPHDTQVYNDNQSFGDSFPGFGRPTPKNFVIKGEGSKLKPEYGTMICVSIGYPKAKELLAKHRRLVKAGVELVEWRLDCLEESIDCSALIAKRPGPIVVTARRPIDGGRFSGAESERLAWLKDAISAEPEYVDLEDEIAGSITRSGSTKRIVSHHDFEKTPENLLEMHEQMAELDPDIIKLATLAISPHDNLRMLQLVKTSEVPTVGLCMGEIGVPSRILGKKFGSPLTYAAASTEEPLGPGQISWEQMRDFYRYPELNADTEVFGVIGDPIQHSYSPLVHNTAFAELKMNRIYLPFRIPAEDLAEFIDDAIDLGIKGLSVTIPHKERVVDKLTKMGELVQGTDAANTILYDGTRRLGYNTDVEAAMESLHEGWEETGSSKSSKSKKKAKPFDGKTVLILGAGGAAKAIAYGVHERGAEVILTSRTEERAAKLAERLECKSIPWEDRETSEPDAVINCTPLGMFPKVEVSPVSKNFLKPNMIVFDTVYHPEETLFIRSARARGCQVVTGIEMFVRQAAAQFKLFTEEDPPVEIMRKVLREAVETQVVSSSTSSA